MISSCMYLCIIINWVYFTYLPSHRFWFYIFMLLHSWLRRTTNTWQSIPCVWLSTSMNQTWISLYCFEGKTTDTLSSLSPRWKYWSSINRVATGKKWLSCNDQQGGKLKVSKSMISSSSINERAQCWIVDTVQQLLQSATKQQGKSHCSFIPLRCEGTGTLVPTINGAI
jgi:hypothetical protein